MRDLDFLHKHQRVVRKSLHYNYTYVLISHHVRRKNLHRGVTKRMTKKRRTSSWGCFIHPIHRICNSYSRWHETHRVHTPPFHSMKRSFSFISCTQYSLLDTSWLRIQNLVNYLYSLSHSCFLVRIPGISVKSSRIRFS